MNKTLLLLFSIGLMSNLNAQKTYQISGQLSNQNNEKIILSYFNGSENVENSTTAVDGKFTLTGIAPEQPTVVRLNTSLDRNTYLGEQKASMFIPAQPLEVVLSENCNLTISGNAQDLNFATVKGDRYNEGFNKLRAADEPFTRKMLELQGYLSQAKKMGVTDGLNDIGKNMVDVRNQSIAVRKKFIAENNSEFVAGWLLSNMAREFDGAGLKAAYDALAENVKQTAYGQAISARIQMVSATESGKAAPSFSKPGVDGKYLSLDQFKGKYLLLDFWGSWCGPCRALNPHLKELYATYKSKGFEILGIACEKAPNLADAISSWKKAIEKDGLTWAQVINNETNSKVDLTKLYGIDAFPTKVLLDPKGNIVARWVGSNGNELDLKLKELLK